MKSKILFYIFIFISSLLARTGYSQNYCLNGYNIAIAITCYNRPEYLKPLLENLAKNPGIHEIPVYFFLDGGIRAKQKELIRIIETSGIPCAKIIRRTENYGCERNLIDARRHLFDQCSYDLVYILEDDNIISTQYIPLTLNLYQWGKKNIQNLGIVSAWSEKHFSVEDKSLLLDVALLDTSGHYWAYLMDRETWDLIKEWHYEYERLFLQYGNFKPEEVRNWIKNKFLNHPNKDDPHGQHWFLSPNYATGQDGVLKLTLWANQLTYTSTVVNRMINVGKHGLHFTPEIWKKFYGDFCLDEFEEDSNVNNFTLIDDYNQVFSLIKKRKAV